MTKHDNPFHMRQYRGSLFDLIGGRTRLPKTEPRLKPTLAQRREALRLRFTPSRVWPKGRVCQTPLSAEMRSL